MGPELHVEYSACLNVVRSEEHTSELQSLRHLVCRLLLEKKNIFTTLTKIITLLFSFLWLRSQDPPYAPRALSTPRRKGNVLSETEKVKTLFFFFLMIRRPRKSPLFPYPPPFR